MYTKSFTACKCQADVFSSSDWMFLCSCNCRCSCPFFSLLQHQDTNYFGFQCLQLGDFSPTICTSVQGHRLIVLVQPASELLPTCFSCGSVMSCNRLASKLQSSVLQMVSSLIRKALMSAKSHVGARICNSVM